MNDAERDEARAHLKDEGDLRRVETQRVAELSAQVERMRKVCERAAVVHKYAPFDAQRGVPPGYWQDINWLGDAVDALIARGAEKEPK